MSTGVGHRVRDLPPEFRRAAEALLGRAIGDDETMTLLVSNGEIVKEAPTGESRQAAFRDLLSHLDRLSDRLKDVPEDHLNAVIDEAVEHSRHHHR